MAEHDSTLITGGARYHKLPGPPSPPPSPPPPPRPTKEKQPPDHHRPIANFLSSRAVLLLLVVFLLPLFPSEAPEFVNQTLLAGAWELFHLLLVGVAVSYGLFSQRNADPAAPEKEADSPQSYLSQLLQVSPVFDDEEPGSPYRPDESRLRMWNSRYQREPPAVVVEAPERAHDGGSSAANRRRLLLPVRSLRRPRVMPAADPPVRQDEHRTLGEIRSPGRPVQKEIFDADGAIFPSPIPWRSRSGKMSTEEGSTFRSVSFRSPGIAASTPARRSPSPDDSPERKGSTARGRSRRMEAKDEVLSSAAAAAVPPGSLLAENTSRSSVSFRYSPSQPRSPAAAAPPRRPSPSPPVSPEPRAKTREDPLTKKTTFSGQPPPPPPLPPPPSVPQPIALGDVCGSPRHSRLVHVNPGTHPDGSYYPAALSVRTVRPREVRQDATANTTTSLKAPGEKKEKKKKEKRKNSYFSNRVEQNAAAADDDDPPTTASGERSISDWVEGGDVAVDVGGRPHGAEIPRAADVPASAAAAEEEENEVDKKADEFIARFREQIRLQRIESIKTAAGPAKA